VEHADGVYARHAWDVQPNEYNAPANSWEERSIRQALVTPLLPRKEISRVVRPPLPQIWQWGAPVHHQPAPGPIEIIGESERLDRGNVRGTSTSFSGTPSGYSGSDRNGWGAMG
jgi:hypothetical protein